MLAIAAARLPEVNTLEQKWFESHLSMSDDIGSTVQVHPLNVDHHLHEEGYAMVDQIVDRNKPVRHIVEASCCVLESSLRS